TFQGSPPLGSSIEDAVDQVRGWDGVLDVVAVGDVSEWAALTGLTSDCADEVTSPPCAPGLAVLTLDSSMSAVAVRLQSEFAMNVVTPSDVPAGFLQAYLAAAIDAASPVPLEFDPSVFGVEQPLTGPLLDLPDAECHCDVAVEVDTDGVLVRAGLDITPADVADEVDVGFGIGRSGTGYAINELLIDGSGRGGVLGLAESVLGRRVYAFAGLPLQAALVRFDLADGSSVWQRPLAGMAVFLDAPGSGVDSSEVQAAGPFVVLDSVGREIMRIDVSPSGVLVDDLRLGDLGSAGSDGKAASPAELVATIDADPLLFDRVGRHLVEAGGALWLHTPDTSGPGIIYVDTTTGAVGRIPLDRRPAALVASPDAIWVGSIGDDGAAVVSRVDLESRTITNTVDIPGAFEHSLDLIVADGRLWISGSSAGFVVVDLTTLAAEALAGDRRQGEIWVGEIDGGLWAYAPADVRPSASLTRIDFRTESVERRDPEIGGLPSGAVAAGDDIWLASWDGEVARFDTRAGEVTDRLSLGTGIGWAGVFADEAMWYFNFNTDTVTRIDASTAEPTAAITIEHSPMAMIVHDGAAWILHGEGLASRLAIDTLQVTDVVDLGAQETPRSFQYLPLPPVATGESVWAVAPDGRVYRLGAAS
ncbi:MAG TPA: hypothetical protein VH761_09715, partial [Ilumatobacteraceae bacterium]